MTITKSAVASELSSSLMKSKVSLTVITMIVNMRFVRTKFLSYLLVLIKKQKPTSKTQMINLMKAKDGDPSSIE